MTPAQNEQPGSPAVTFGTAQLYEAARGVRPADLLAEAWRVGVRRFDTAPLYGNGRAEADLGAFLRDRDGVDVVTTKVGLAPARPRPVRRAVLGTVERVLPGGLVQRLRDARAGEDVPERASGRFGLAEVTASVQESLRRLGGRVDRLLLHEVRPLDVTPELVAWLAGLVRSGDVGAVGVATGNRDTAEVLERGGDLFTVANVSVGMLSEPVALPAHVTVRIGHGLLGGGGDHLRRLGAARDADHALGERWRSAVAGTAFDTERGLADALLSRGAGLDVTDLLVATTRVGNVARACELAAGTEPLPATVSGALADLVTAASGPRR